MLLYRRILIHLTLMLLIWEIMKIPQLWTEEQVINFQRYKLLFQDLILRQ
jgi:hypothetical protein